MSGRATHGSFYTVGLVSTPAPQHRSATTTSSSAATTFSATYTTTPLQHLDHTLASMSSSHAHALPPLSYPSDSSTLAPPRLTASNTPPPSSTPPSFASPHTISSFGSPPPSSTPPSFATPPQPSATLDPAASLSANQSPPFPRYGRGPTTFGTRLSSTPRPGVMTTLTRPSVVTTRSPGLNTLTTHGPTVTTYTTYNPAMNKFTTHTPVTTTTSSFLPDASSQPPSSAFLRYTPSSSRFVSLTTTTTVTPVTPPPRRTANIYTLSPHVTDSAAVTTASINFPPPPKVTLASTATSQRPSPSWPLHVTLGASEGYDNLHLDVGEEEVAGKPQVRTHMTKEEFLAAPYPGLEMHETGEKAAAESSHWSGRRGWPSGQERLEERRRGGVWNMSLYPTSTSTSVTTTFIPNTTATTTTFSATPPPQRQHLTTTVTPTATSSTSTFTGGYCNQAVEAEGEDGAHRGIWTVEGGEVLRRKNKSPPFPDPCTPPPPDRDSLTPPPHPDAADTRFSLRDVPLKGEWVTQALFGTSVGGRCTGKGNDENVYERGEKRGRNMKKKLRY
ncbi:mucin-2-like [Eriocheir sinensis]|uniref:mucin-2-like n=1 Tax=Eriocheir sinensis TaxID=95602 RepID=UPI0021C62889|nr:mucin-2-like [Eriocheir sinensis]